ncbi:MAG: hypothetical protein M1831_005247 [Alyxoria varia]|nr:MAG: hypothetical protein M1831_005247 [Alyxoria varia]
MKVTSPLHLNQFMWSAAEFANYIVYVLRPNGPAFRPTKQRLKTMAPSVLIVGGTRGLGAALAKQYVTENNQVFATARSKPDDVISPSIHWITSVDVSSMTAGKTITNAIKEPLDTVIITAGYFGKESFDSVDFEAEVSMYKVSAIGPIFVVQALVQAGLLQKSSRVILVSSESGSITLRHESEGGGMYGHHGSKAALNMAGKLLSLDLKEKGIAVVMVHPGFMRTEMTASVGFDQFWDSGGAVTAEEAARSLIPFVKSIDMSMTGEFWAPRGPGSPINTTMSHWNGPGIGATYQPGYDDYYMPQSPQNVISPSPQRIRAEVPGQIQTNLQKLDLNSTPQSYGHPPAPQGMSSPSSAYTPSVYSNSPQDSRRMPPSKTNGYDQNQAAGPNFSGIPRLPYRTPNIPETDEEREVRLDKDRQSILDSPNYEDQLGWAQDVLSLADSAAEQSRRLAQTQQDRPGTPPVERQLRLDAMNIVEHMATQRHPRALFMKGMWMEFGKFGQREDRKEAFRMYKTAASNGYARAEYRMGMLFESTNEPGQALQHYRRGEATGDAASCYRMGMIAALGQLGQPQDFGRAVNLIKHAADYADENAPQGAYVYGMMLAKDLAQIKIPDQYLPIDIDAAKGYIERSAFLGFSKAQLKTGSAYELCALHCEFNPLLSLHYNSLAAKQGEPEAELAISKWFICGHENVFQKNEELAYKYAQRAAQSGLATAEFAMGYFYEIGWYVSKNISQAQEWYQKAARNGNKEASDGLERLSNSQGLSRHDHESVAISRIKSTHASKRGQRPARLTKPNSNLPPVQDIPTPASPQRQPSPAQYPPPHNPGMPPRSGTADVLPPRSSSIAPYPMDDRPATVAPAAPVQSAPYPSSDGPGSQPRKSSGPAGGLFGPGQRPVSALQPQDARPYAGAGPPGGQASLRPYQSMTNLPGSSPAPPGQPRPPPRAPQGYGASTGPPPPMRPPKDPVQGNAGPSASPYQGSPGEPYRRAEVNRPGLAARSSFDSRASSATAASGPFPQFGAQTPTQGSPMLRPQSRPNSRPSSSGRPSAADAAPSSNSGGQKPGGKPTPAGPSSLSGSKPASRPPGKGPQTFEEMGVPIKQSDSDCVVM